MIKNLNGRYLVFGGEAYYPFGGWADFITSTDNLEDAIKLASHEDDSFGQVIDKLDLSIVFKRGGSVYLDMKDLENA